MASSIIYNSKLANCRRKVFNIKLKEKRYNLICPRSYHKEYTNKIQSHILDVSKVILKTDLNAFEKLD